jgi:hypothetical protein
MRRFFIVCFALVLLGLAGCETGQPPARGTVGGAKTEGFTDPSYQPAPYTRINRPDTNTVQLQLAVRTFVPVGRRGQTIWLAGASHVGEPEYYHNLQKQLDARTIVLYEGVNVDAHPQHVVRPGTEGVMRRPIPQAMKSPGGFSLQAALAKSLGLVFQLDAIDYNRPNFINSDLSILEIQRIMLDEPDAVPAPPGAKGRSDPSFDFLLQIMDGSSFIGGLFKLGIEYIGTDPQLQAVSKLTLIETLGRIKGDFSQMRGLPPGMQRLVKVLIEARNQRVVDDLKTELKAVPRSGSIGVFYGTGHMEDMEKRVTHQLNYRPDGNVWLTAFSVDIRKTGLSPYELQMMQNLLKWQMNQLGP